ncbi:MAG: protein kinase [Verrucomicrobia bacterium]|nr:protein kinase [Verrucomicrobiota bacterium]
MNKSSVPSPQEREAALFALAVEKPSAERAAFLQAVCGGDSALRQRLDALLAAHEQPEKVLATAARAVKATIKLDLESEPPDEAVGQTLGRYKLLERVGEGGCGVVYVAEQTEPVRRRVALKVIKLGMDTKQVVARFEAERQALAMMDHPNIAKVLDAGTTAVGRPFFVMELVRGIKITDYCDQANLTTKERLDLFIKVCQAIQHAHQKGIIHRDIKPSNILVTLHDGVPVPKVIDFGIAKAPEGRLTDATVYTQLHQFIGTPAYMSPEQAEMSGLDIDTRSDIYSLGVLLYELLTGKTPFDANELMSLGIEAMRKTIREKDPVRPSTRLATLQGDELTTTAKRRSADTAKLLHQLKGDLDWIAMKCLEKDRTRRYDTATGLAADIKRHLENEPVVARPPSTGYKLQKAWQRHKVLVTACVLIGLSLGFGISFSLRQALRARRAERAKQVLFESERKAREAATQAQNEAMKERDNARRHLYAANINLANQAWNDSNLGKTRRLLASAIPEAGQEDLRGWEWRYLWGQTSGDDTAEIARFNGGVFHLAFTDNDRSVVVGLTGFSSEERGISLFDLTSDRLTNRRVLGASPVSVSAFLPEKRWLATSQVGANRHIAILNFTTMEAITRLPVPSAVRDMEFSRDGQRLAAYHAGGEVRVWRTDDWSYIPIMHSSGNSGVHFAGLSFLGSGERIAIGWSSGKVSVHESATGTKLREFTAHSEGITAFAISPTADVIATGAGYSDKTVKLWKSETGEAAGELGGHQAWISGLAFSPDGALLASASSDQTIRLWDVKTRNTIGVLRGHEDEIYCLAFSGDGKKLLSGAKDGSVRLWNVPPTQRPPALRVLREPFGYFMIAPDSRRVVTLAADYVVWDLNTGEKLETISALRGYQAGYDFTLDGRKLLAGGRNGKVRIWDFENNALSEFAAGDDDEEIVAVRRLGATEFVATVHGLRTKRTFSTTRVKIWDFNKRQLKETTGLSGAMATVSAVSPQGKTATGHEDGRVTIWGKAGTKFLAHPRTVVGAAFTPDGSILATGGEEGTAKLWDVATLREIGTLKGHLRSIHALDISPDGQRLATAGGGDESLKLWDVRAHQELITLSGEGSMMNQLAFSPDGNKIVGLNNDGGLHIWRAPSWAEINAAGAKEKAEGKQP